MTHNFPLILARVVLVTCAALWLSPAAAGATRPPSGEPAARAIALTSSEIPKPAFIATRYSQYFLPRQLNADTVPEGLSVKHLRQAGFRGLYTQLLQRPNDDVPLGYPWTYLAFPSAASAHRMWAEWVSNIKRPFNYPKGTSNAGNECRVYQSVLSSHEIGLLCRIGPYVVYGHYRSKASVESLMRPVAERARTIKP